MPDIFLYTDYRSFLSDWFEESKRQHPYMSYRYLGGKIPTDPGYLVRILGGQRHISEAMIPGFIKALHLSDQEAQYFQALVPFTKARGERSVRDALQKLLALRDLRVTTLNSDQYKFYQTWYHTAVRLVLALGRFDGDYEALSRSLSPEITTDQARESVQLLQELGLVHEEPDGIWHLREDFISTGDSWKGTAVKEFQRQTLNLAMESMDRHTRDERAISTLSLAIPSSELPALKEITKQFRAQIMRWAGVQTEPDTIYQVNIQIFPMSQTMVPDKSGDAR